METTEVQPQANGEVQVPVAGPVTAQSPEQAPVAEQPGAATKAESTPAAEVKPEAPKTPKVYTEDEVRQRESRIISTLQAETAQMRDHAARLELTQQIQALAQAEQQAQYKDQQEVTNGLITDQEAAQRKGQRMQHVQTQAELQKMQQTLQQQRQVGEANARILVAQKISQEYGIPFDSIVNEPDPHSMEKAAWKMALKTRDEALRKATVKPESFDKGPQAETTGPDTYEQSLKSRYPTMYSNK